MKAYRKELHYGCNQKFTKCNAILANSAEVGRSLLQIGCEKSNKVRLLLVRVLVDSGQFHWMREGPGFKRLIEDPECHLTS